MTWRPLTTFSGHRGSVYALHAGDRPGTFLSAGGDGQVVRWRIDQPDHGELIATVDEAIFSLHLLHDRNVLLVGKEGGGLHVLDLAGRREARLIEAHRKGLFAIIPLTNEQLACSGGDGAITIWETRTMDLLRTIPICEGKVRGMAVSHDGTRLAAACGDGTVRVFDTTDMNEHFTLEAHAEGAQSVAFHPHKPVLISGGKDGHLRFWHAGEGFRTLHAIAAHKAGIYSIAFSSPGHHCATASRDKSTKLWDAASFDLMQRLEPATGPARSVNALLWKGDMLLCAGDDRLITGWSANSGTP